MDAVLLFAQTPPDAAADPWKWETLLSLLRGLLRHEAPWFVVLLLGMAAAVAYRRRHPAVARRVLIGCAGLLLVRVALALSYWVWTILDPDPEAPYRPLRRWVCAGRWDSVGLGCAAAALVGQAAFLWVLVSAVVHGRGGPPEREKS